MKGGVQVLIYNMKTLIILILFPLFCFAQKIDFEGVYNRVDNHWNFSPCKGQIEIGAKEIKIKEKTFQIATIQNFLNKGEQLITCLDGTVFRLNECELYLYSEGIYLKFNLIKL